MGTSSSSLSYTGNSPYCGQSGPRVWVLNNESVIAGFVFSQTSVIYFAGDLVAVRVIVVSARLELPIFNNGPIYTRDGSSI